ncbi:MAG: ABC transporter permease [Trueperaceae bacterium]|nr:ABC transporter permease [Trueperaceae bacterium]
MSKLRQAVPVLAVLGIFILLGYPLALVFGLPLAWRDMQDLRKWEKETVTAQPLADVSDRQTLRFDEGFESGVLVYQGEPLAATYTQDGATVMLETPLETVVMWGATLTPVGASEHVYTVGEAVDAEDPFRAVYVGDRLMREGSSPPLQLPDGQRTDFTFRSPDGPILVDDALIPRDAYQTDGANVIFADAPPFGSNVRRITGDYAVLDASDGSFYVVTPPQAEIRLAADVIRLAEQLQPVSGDPHRYRFGREKVFDNDRERLLYVNDMPLVDQNERPAERVDGERREFLFPSERGIVTIDSVVMAEGQSYTRDGTLVRFVDPPVRNARVRQHTDYYLTNPDAGTVLLAEPPASDAVVWTSRYTVYGEPGCGPNVMACFLALPQHPVPFPHWIAASAVPFVQKFPLADERNIVRATLYTTLGTLAALGLGGAIGILLAIAFVLFRPLERALLPWVVASQTVPIIALVPVLLLILGNFGITIQTSLLPTAIIGAYIAFFPVVVGTVKGLRSVDPLSLDLMKTYAASQLQVFVKVRFPAAVPFFFTSLKLGVAAALVGALVAETESNNRRGLGFAIIGQVQSGNVADVWILLIISALLGIGLVALVDLAQRVIAPWERT